jgi:hypothetical protein
LSEAELTAITARQTRAPGRPTKYTPETLDRLLTAVADGLTLQQSCIACGIGNSTLNEWRQEHPDLEPRLEQAREKARQKALATLRDAAQQDWRAMEAFLKYSFHADYRRQPDNVSVTATAQAASAPTLVCTEEQRQELIAQLDRLKDKPRE